MTSKTSASVFIESATLGHARPSSAVTGVWRSFLIPQMRKVSCGVPTPPHD